MTAYIIKKFIISLIVLLFVSFLAYVIISVLPGDAALIALGENATPEKLAEYRAMWGLDQPLLIRYYNWLKDILRGDFGYSTQFKDQCINVLMQRLPVTIRLGAMSLLFGIIFGIAFGIIAALNRGKFIDTLVTFISNIGVSLPVFWLGMVFIYLLAVRASILPVQGYAAPEDGFTEYIRYSILPCMTMCIGSMATISRQTRSAVLETLHQHHVKTAHAKGLQRKTVLFKHILKNSLIPVITLLGFQVRNLVGGSVIVEQIFGIPGMGRTLVQSVNGRDANMVLACLLLIAVITIIANLLVDIAYGLVDPRIRLGGHQ